MVVGSLVNNRAWKARGPLREAPELIVRGSSPSRIRLSSGIGEAMGLRGQRLQNPGFLNL